MGESIVDGMYRYYGLTREMYHVDESVDDGTWTRMGRGGTHEWRDANGDLHRDDDKPAVIDPVYGWCSWFQRGQLHRDDDKPAHVDELAGLAEWYQHGQPARAGLEPSHIQLPTKNETRGCRLWLTTGYRTASAPTATTPWTRNVHYAWRGRWDDTVERMNILLSTFLLGYSRRWTEGGWSVDVDVVDEIFDGVK